MMSVKSPGQNSDHSPVQILALFAMGQLTESGSYPNIALSVYPFYDL